MTKNQIIEVATNLILEKGDLGWSYADIAEKVKIRKASIHYYFPKKEDLILEATKLYINNALSSLNKKLQFCQNAEKKLDQVFAMYKNVYNLKGKICLCISLSQDVNRNPQAVNEHIHYFFDSMKVILTEIILEGQSNKEFNLLNDPSITATLILGMLQGLLMFSQHNCDEKLFDQCQIQIKQLLKN